MCCCFLEGKYTYKSSFAPGCARHFLMPAPLSRSDSGTSRRRTRSPRTGARKAPLATPVRRAAGPGRGRSRAGGARAAESFQPPPPPPPSLPGKGPVPPGPLPAATPRAPRRSSRLPGPAGPLPPTPPSAPRERGIHREGPRAPPTLNTLEPRLLGCCLFSF